MAITTRTELVNWVKTMLGEPIIRVEVADQQFTAIIDKSVKDFQRYHYGEGAYLDYGIFTTSAGIGVYNLSGYNIIDVVDLHLNDRWGYINTLHSPTHILFQELGQGPGSGPLQHWDTVPLGYGPPPGLEITEYQIAMQYIELIRDQFGTDYTTNWLPGREELRITPTPTEAVTGLLTLYRKENEANILDNTLFNDLVLARVKRLWGFILNKSVISIPGGGTVSGREILDEGKEDEREIMDQIKGESNPPDFFIG